jgi:hypothetical protein
MTLQHRIDLMVQLGNYMLSQNEEWLAVKERASYQNAWFIPEFVELSVNNIAQQFLKADKLQAWVKEYNVPIENPSPKQVGVVMAGNIPLVGFHDFLCVFITGHSITIKLSSKDELLLKHLVQKLHSWNEEVKDVIQLAEQLKGCDAYIATGSNNSSRYFEQYFGKYPNIIRKNRTSVAILNGQETKEQLDLLADDIQLYFGLGCRNITKLYVPEGYDFIPLLEALKKYDHYFAFHKYKNNYDYHLALLMMANKKYMTNSSIIFTEEPHLFSPISQVNYVFYTDKAAVVNSLQGNDAVQCIVGNGFIDFGGAQQPSLTDYADGVDTMEFLMKL